MHHWTALLFSLAFSFLCIRAEAQLFKRLKTETVSVANQKADQKAINTTSQSIDQVDNLINKGIKGILHPKKKEKKPEEQPQQAAPTVTPAPDSTQHAPGGHPVVLSRRSVLIGDEVV